MNAVSLHLSVSGREACSFYQAVLSDLCCKRQTMQNAATKGVEIIKCLYTGTSKCEQKNMQLCKQQKLLNVLIVWRMLRMPNDILQHNILRRCILRHDTLQPDIQWQDFLQHDIPLQDIMRHDILRNYIQHHDMKGNHSKMESILQNKPWYNDKHMWAKMPEYRLINAARCQSTSKSMPSTMPQIAMSLDTRWHSRSDDTWND